jgi:TM2 domain-containing membrane protein YozV
VPQRVSAGDNIGELLLREGLITNAQLDMALAHQRETDKPLIRILVEAGALDETKRLNFFKRQFGVPMVTIAATQIDPLLYTYIPAALARRHHIVPVKLDKDGLVVAMEDPSDLMLLDHLKEIVGLRIKPVVAASGEILEALAGFPEEKPVAKLALKPEKFDPAARIMSAVFLPLVSAASLAGVFALLWYSKGFREMIALEQLDTFTRFLYIFLSWGVWTIILFEARGLVFDDMAWRDEAALGPEKSRARALVLSLLLGWLGLDRFYLGYWKMGLLKLFTLGVAGLWWLLDLLCLLGRRIPDAAGRPLR